MRYYLENILFMNRNIKSASLCLLAIGFLILNGCKKDPLKNLSNDDSRIYISNHDSTANFATYKTFSISDSASVIEDNHFLGRVLGTYETSLIAQLKQIMQQRGYTLVDTASKPDLALNISEVVNTQTTIFSYDDYWDSYGYYYDPGYYGYPGYGYYSPYSYGSYTVASAALEIDLLDLKNATADGDKITAIWVGLARGEDVFNSNNIATTIATLFGQSAYLKTGN